MPDVSSDAERGDIEARYREALEKDRRQAKQLRRNARTVFRALEGWQRVGGAEEWAKVCQESREEYESGRFLLERLGAERHLDPKLMATLLHLRQALIAECGITTVTETILVDLTVLSYYHTLRAQRWIGDLALHIEHEFFGQDSPTPKASKRFGRADGLAVEEDVRRLVEHLMPLLDRANRMVIRNMKAIKELRQGPVPAIAIGRAEQVTVTNQQNGRAPRSA
jgi:hypothetical protein